MTLALEALVVLILFLIPGLLADGLYRFVLWRPDPEEHVRITRAVLFSGAGLVIIAVLRTVGVGVSFPVYIDPSWWKRIAEGTPLGSSILSLWLLHILSAVLAASLSVWVMSRNFVASGLKKLTSQSLYSNAWKEYSARYFGQWVFVTLADGREYYGRLGVVSGKDTQDFVLWDPCPVDRAAGTYQLVGTESLFVPGSQVTTVMVARDVQDIQKQAQLLGTYSLQTGDKTNDEGRKGPPIDN